MVSSCHPSGMAVDKINSGNVYVTDTYNHRIQKFGVAATVSF